MYLYIVSACDTIATRVAIVPYATGGGGAGANGDDRQRCSSVTGITAIHQLRAECTVTDWSDGRIRDRWERKGICRAVARNSCENDSRTLEKAIVQMEKVSVLIY